MFSRPLSLFEHIQLAVLVVELERADVLYVLQYCVKDAGNEQSCMHLDSSLADVVFGIHI